jgi:hypothetical protein
LKTDTTVHIAQADSLSDIFTQSHVDGELRTHYFSRLFGAPNTTDANALAVGALINFRSGSFASGFSLGGSFLTANSPGHAVGQSGRDRHHSDGSDQLDQLAGPGLPAVPERLDAGARRLPVPQHAVDGQ